MSESKLSCKMTRCHSEEEVEKGGPGCFFFEQEPDYERHLHLNLPDGTYIWIHVRLQNDPHPQGHPSWEWDGNEDAPTLTPSIHTHGVWHGYAKAGVLESV
jgi:hypothetical protein